MRDRRRRGGTAAMCELGSRTLESRVLDEVKSQGGLAVLTAYDTLRAEGACLVHFCDALRALARDGRVFSSDPASPITPEIPAVKLLELAVVAGTVSPEGAPRPRVRKYAEGITVYFDRPLGRGSAGTVYRGDDRRSGRPVAVKVLSLKPRLPEEIRAWFLERFRQEPRLLHRLDHPHVVKVAAWGEADGGPWYAMELLEGGTLADRIRADGRLPAGEVRDYFRAIALALAEASRQGILHRDVKPSNIFNRGIKLADFGAAKIPVSPGAPEDLRTITQAGAVVGTMPYIAPERLGAASADQRADLYSLGATMYHAATGKFLFDLPAGDRRGWADRHLHAEPRPVQERAADFPGKLAAVIERCLRKNPADRYSSFPALLDALDRSN